VKTREAVATAEKYRWSEDEAIVVGANWSTQLPKRDSIQTRISRKMFKAVFLTLLSFLVSALAFAPMGRGKFTTDESITASPKMVP
jgi:hypothetical protein